ncbi:MAG: hypothetical protein SFU56_07775 [Capsulimonadales bacterium]|nr:hypothetical protein [Capsulimonadales bacterium]
MTRKGGALIADRVAVPLAGTNAGERGRRPTEFLPAMSLALVAGWLAVAMPSSRAEPPQEVSLGLAHRKPVVARIERKAVPDAPVDIRTIAVSFRIGNGARAVRTSSFDVGETYLRELRFGAYPFTDRHHQQLFITVTLGRVQTFVLAPANGSVRKLYARTGGRVVVKVRRARSGTCNLEEHWPRQQWEDFEDLGPGRFDPATGSVRRVLRWNGRGFVPIAPERRSGR